MSYVRFLAAQAEAEPSPFPRCQDLPPGSYIEEAPPVGQVYVVSYTWSATDHPSPGGAKMRELAAVLDRLGASDDGGVFFDFPSLPQGGGKRPDIYLSTNPYARKAPLLEELDGRNEEEVARFKFALFETTRLYAYGGSKVIVLPDKDDVSSFPDVGEVTEKLNDFCEPPRMETHSNWGFTKKMGYENSGWCCAEFAIAKRNGTIVNMDDAPVQRVLKSREWPNTATEYAAMMESKEQPVHFTKKGDAEAVRFNFFKNAYSLIGED